MEGKWIKCSDRLPDEDTFKVLACFDEPFFGKMTKEIEVAYYSHDDKEWINELTNKRILRVTHWMPLPEPPTED